MSIEPWDIRADDRREADTVATFIIYCEDEVSEPAYFRSFNLPDKLKVNAVQNQKQANLNFLNTVSQCVKDGKIEYTPQGYRIKEEVSENIWSVYDRDMEHEDAELLKPEKDIEFTTAIYNAMATGVKVAWSNDAFELWLLLHFEDVPTGQRLHRSYIYERLTQIFRNLLNPSQALQEVVSKERFSYKESFKKRTNFVQHVLPILTEERREAAFRRAIALEMQYTESVPFHQRNPCTMIHKLVAELLAAS